MTESDSDVGIFGAGPAGSSMAAYLARAGMKCVVLEKELFPRPHVGESLVPSSTRVFKELHFLPVMKSARFPRKYGAVWTAENARTGRTSTPAMPRTWSPAPLDRLTFGSFPVAGASGRAGAWSRGRVS